MGGTMLSESESDDVERRVARRDLLLMLCIICAVDGCLCVCVAVFTVVWEPLEWWWCLEWSLLCTVLVWLTQFVIVLARSLGEEGVS